MKKIQLVLSIILSLLIINIISTSFFNYDIIATVSNRKNDNDYYIFIDLDKNIMKVYYKNSLHKSYPVSSGAPSTPSPLGTWTITSKADWGEGFGGTWMGFNVPWGKYGIHGTDEPWSIGQDLSKGCIRMYNDDAAELKSYIPHGTKVTIVKGPYGPYGTGLRTLKPGDTGSDVYALQKELQELGYYTGWVDGKYGDGMKNAVKKFQKDNGITVTTTITLEFYEKIGIELFE